jgi:hypothetical protein
MTDTERQVLLEDEKLHKFLDGIIAREPYLLPPDEHSEPQMPALGKFMVICYFATEHEDLLTIRELLDSVTLTLKP